MEHDIDPRIDASSKTFLCREPAAGFAAGSDPCKSEAWDSPILPIAADGEDCAYIETNRAPEMRDLHKTSSEAFCASITAAEFIENRFIPEVVALKHPAGQTYFKAILKHVLPPEMVNRAFAASPTEKKTTLKAVRGWPYIHSLPLSDVTPQVIRQLTAAALASGYSIQTATHIRNVIRSVIAHGIRTGCYQGSNPALAVSLPPLTRREMPNLSIGQLAGVFKAMRYPEREVAMFTLLTDMNVAEICGLRWKFTNLSSTGSFVDHESIPAKTLAIRYQSYRGELVGVMGRRRRFVRVPELLESALKTLKKRDRFTSPDDFVLVSRNGSPLRPENIAARRLKTVGKALDLPWLSWSAFQRTRLNLQFEIGRNFHRELADLLTAG